MPLFDIKKKPAKKEENLYTNIFDKQDKKKEDDDSKVLSGVFAKEDKSSKENILGSVPELEKNLIGSFDPRARNLKIVKIVLGSLVGALLLAVTFFYSELNPKFDLLSSVRGPNTIQQLNNIKNSVITTQTSINQKNYLLMSYYLQKLSYLSDGYAKIRKSTSNLKTKKTVQDDIILTYENALTKWKEPIVAGTIPENTFKVQLKNVFRNEINQLKKETRSPSVNAEIKNYTTALHLIENNKLGTIFQYNTSDIKNDLPRDDTKLFALTQTVLANLKNDFSVISDLKLKRIQWSIIIKEIERVTKNIDTLYNTGFFDELGGIKYSNFDFDAETNRIILTGHAKRDDGTTFTLIVNLIDALEDSSLFKDVDNRTYPKSGSEKTGYTSPFRIELSLEDNYAIT
ncbi:hypothetical protein J7J83_02130 [bacterium]|nr:hypothetical protein [bacterium]